MLSEDGDANVSMSGAYVSKNIIEVIALMQFRGRIDVVDKPVYEGVSATHGCVIELMFDCEVVAGLFPSQIGGAQLVWWCGVPFCLCRVKM